MLCRSLSSIMRQNILLQLYGEEVLCSMNVLWTPVQPSAIYIRSWLRSYSANSCHFQKLIFKQRFHFCFGNLHSYYAKQDCDTRNAEKRDFGISALVPSV